MVGKVTYKGSLHTCCQVLFHGGSSCSVTAMLSVLYLGYPSMGTQSIEAFGMEGLW